MLILRHSWDKRCLFFFDYREVGVVSHSAMRGEARAPGHSYIAVLSPGRAPTETVIISST